MVTAIQAWDEVFIRCTRQSVNALVTDPALWALWWPGTTVTPITPGTFAVQQVLRWPTPAIQRLTIRVDRVRPRDKGLEFTVTGDVDGTGEWFHLEEPDGVVVNHLLRGECARPAGRWWLTARRGIVRAGLSSLKDRLEAGRPPGAEPDPALLAHQVREREIFAVEVARHEAELAAAAKEAADAV